MKPASLILTIVLVILIIGGVLLYMKGNLTTPIPGTNNGNTNGQVFCTQDAKLCPDGSYVGRVAPSCNFAACPVGSTSTSTLTLIPVGLNQTIQESGISITPFEIVEDSRCPVDVTCIQAGRVRVNTRITTQTSSSTEILTSSTPFAFGSTTITLANVQPEKRSTVTTATTSYRFTFTVTHK